MFPEPESKKKSQGLGRVIRSVVAVIVITAFVLGVSFATKQLYDFKITVFSSKVDPYLNKVGLSTDQIGEVAGALTKRLDANINPNVQTSESDSQSNPSTANNESPVKNVVGQVALISDIEGKNDLFKKALGIVSSKNITNAILLGDLTSYGDIPSLVDVKNILVSSQINYYVLPGDHDLADSANNGDSTGMKNFTEVFGYPTSNIALFGKKFLLVNNSANHTVIPSDSFEVIKQNLGSTDILILSQPIYSPVLQRSMGVIDGVVDEPVKSQADELLSSVRTSNITGVFSGDLHMSARYTDVVDPDLKYYFIGSVTDEPSIPSPRFSVMTIYGDGTYTVEDIQLN